MTLKSTVKTSILEGVRDELKATIAPNADNDLGRIVKLIEKNWSGEKSRGRLNWHLRRVGLHSDSNYKNDNWSNSEVLLERRIVEGFCGPGDLFNQMPVASGLLELQAKEDRTKKVSSEGRRAVDLVYKPNTKLMTFEFLELKVLRNNGVKACPHDAALELLEYGLLYLFSRKHREKLGYSSFSSVNDPYGILNATCVRLRVLAPPCYYLGRSKSEFPVTTVNRALEKYVEDNAFGDLTMNIGYETLGPGDNPHQMFLNKKATTP